MDNLADAVDRLLVVDMKRIPHFAPICQLFQEMMQITQIQSKVCLFIVKMKE